ncbi:MAG: porin family protein [Dysgonomonas sp.]|nr:porin family protein [Dysgonomonas sp.]
MRRTILAVLLLFIGIYAYSQSSMIGLRGSFNISSMSTGDAKSKMGFSVGGIYTTPLSDAWHFQPSLLFSLNGVRAADSYSPDYSAHYYSVEIPLMLSRRWGEEDINIGFDMGPFLRYGLFGGYWTDSDAGRIKPDIFDSQKRFDVGPQIGFSVIANNLYIGYSFQYGLIKPWSEKKGHYYNSSINFGYLFNIY